MLQRIRNFFSASALYNMIDWWIERQFSGTVELVTAQCCVWKNVGLLHWLWLLFCDLMKGGGVWSSYSYSA